MKPKIERMIEAVCVDLNALQQHLAQLQIELHKWRPVEALALLDLDARDLEEVQPEREIIE